MSGAPRCRAMRPADLPAVLAVQAACYPPAFIEPPATLCARLAAAPDTAWVAERNGAPCAYLVAYRSRIGRVTPLGGDFAPDPRADALYLHDLAVAPEAAGAGCGSRLVDRALRTARREGLQLALVAVGDALAFWLRQGFRDAGTLVDAAQCAHLASYPGTARYLVRPA